MVLTTALDRPCGDSPRWECPRNQAVAFRFWADLPLAADKCLARPIADSVLILWLFTLFTHIDVNHDLVTIARLDFPWEAMACFDAFATSRSGRPAQHS
jgi:hypothetical protein